jgi:outer membrane protein assembly factor BamB
VWRVPTELPAWGSPVAAGDQVIFGLGNGRLIKSVEPPEQPAGAVLGVDRATGRRLWQYDVADGVLVRPVVDARRVYVVARDSYCYAVDRAAGRLVWRTKSSSPLVAAPALADGRLYVAASAGQVYRLDAASGAIVWTFDMASHTQTKPRLFAAPTVAVAGREIRIYVGAELQGPSGSAAVLYCLRDE